MKRKSTPVSFVSCTLVVIALYSSADVHARGPGSGRGMGASASGGLSGGGPSGSGGTTLPPSNPGREMSESHVNRSGNAGWSGAHPQYSAAFENRGPNQQQINEARNYEHRFEQAQKLRTLSERNGNSHLIDTANRMELQAGQHYDQRMERIASLPTPPGVNPVQPGQQATSDSPRVGAAAPFEKPATEKNRRHLRWWPFR